MPMQPAERCCGLRLGSGVVAIAIVDVLNLMVTILQNSVDMVMSSRGDNLNIGALISLLISTAILPVCFSGAMAAVNLNAPKLRLFLKGHAVFSVQSAIFGLIWVFSMAAEASNSDESKSDSPSSDEEGQSSPSIPVAMGWLLCLFGFRLYCGFIIWSLMSRIETDEMNDQVPIRILPMHHGVPRAWTPVTQSSQPIKPQVAHVVHNPWAGGSDDIMVAIRMDDSVFEPEPWNHDAMGGNISINDLLALVAQTNIEGSAGHPILAIQAEAMDGMSSQDLHTVLSLLPGSISEDEPRNNETVVSLNADLHDLPSDARNRGQEQVESTVST